LLEVENDIGCVFQTPGSRRIRGEYTFDFDGGDGSAFNGAQQRAAQAVTDGRAPSALKRLRENRRIFPVSDSSSDARRFGFLKPFHIVFLPSGRPKFGCLKPVACPDRRRGPYAAYFE